MNVKIAEQNDIIKHLQEQKHSNLLPGIQDLIKQKATIDRLQEQNVKLQIQNHDLESAHKSLSENETKLNAELVERDMIVLKKDLEVVELQKEIRHLQDYLKEKDNIIHQMAADSNELKTSLELIQNKMRETGNIIDLAQKLKDEQRASAELRDEISLLRSDVNESSNPNELEDISGQVQQELDYSALLDSNILNAIENSPTKNSPRSRQRRERLQKVDNFNIEVPPTNPTNMIEDLEKEVEKLNIEKNDLTEELKKINSCNHELVNLKDSLISELDEIRKQLNNEKDNCVRLQNILVEEKQASEEVLDKDANMIEQIRLRLEEALVNENKLGEVIKREQGLRLAISEELKLVQDRLEATLRQPQSLQQTIISLEQENRRLKNDLQNKENAVSDWRDKNVDLDKEIMKLNLEKLEMQMKVDELQLKLENVDMKKIEIQDQIREENMKLKMDKVAMENKISELELKMMMSQTEFTINSKELLEEGKKLFDRKLQSARSLDESSHEKRLVSNNYILIIMNIL